VVLPLLILALIVWLFITGLRPTALVEPVSRGVALDAVPGSITVKPAYSVTITSDVSGRILRSAMEIGKEVEEGDFLIEIDPTELRLQYESFKADYEAFKRNFELRLRDQVNLQQKQDDLEDAERVFAAGNLSRLEIERKRQDLELYLESQEAREIADERELRTREIRLQEWQRTLEKTTILAPNDGVVTNVFAWPGELIGVRTSIATIISNDLLIEAKINEENFAGIQIGQPARIRFLTYGDRLFNAEVSRVLPNVDPSTQQYTVYLRLTEEDFTPTSGLTGEVSIIKARRDDTLLVPRRALFGEYVYVINGNQVELRRVRRGFLGLNQAEVLDGLEEGDLVISDEIDRFRDGDRVNVNLAGS